MISKVMETLERLYKEYGFGHPIQTRPKPEPGFTGEDPLKWQKAAEEEEEKLQDEKVKRAKELRKNPGDISQFR